MERERGGRRKEGESFFASPLLFFLSLEPVYYPGEGKREMGGGGGGGGGRKGGVILFFHFIIFTFSCLSRTSVLPV